MYSPKIDDLIDLWRDELLEKLGRWLAIDSSLAPESAPDEPFGKNCADMLALALSDAREMGFETVNADGYAGHVSMGGGKRTMGILAHLDVVPEGEGWTLPAFAATFKDGRVYGRGVADDKGPALAALYAMRAVREAGVTLKDGVRLILGCDEETGMKDMRHYASKWAMPDYGFSPDAEYPLINIEKGGLGLLLSAPGGDEEGAEIPVYELYAGERPNVVPGKATAVLGAKRVCAQALREKLASYPATVEELDGGRARITMTGVSSHGAMPELGKNAAGLLLKALSECGAGGASREAISALAACLGTEYDGSSLGIRVSDEKSGPLTCNLGILRYDGVRLTAQLDIRYPIAADETVMCGQACVALSGTPVSVRRLSGRPVLHVPEESFIVQKLLKVYADYTGKPAYPVAIGGGTYSRMMPNTVAFGCRFPEDDDPCHTPDEYMDVEKYLLSVKIMAHAIEQLAGEDAE